MYPPPCGFNYTQHPAFEILSKNFTKYLKSRMWELKPQGGGDTVLAAYLWSYEYIHCVQN